MNKLILAALVAGAPLTAAAAQSMNAEQFHQRATALQKKGALAIFSRGEIRALMTEGKAAADQARGQRLAAEKRGQAPRYCPPKAPSSLGSNEFMARLAAIPAAERARINMTEAMTRVLAAKFPC